MEVFNTVTQIGSELLWNIDGIKNSDWLHH